MGIRRSTSVNQAAQLTCPDFDHSEETCSNMWDVRRLEIPRAWEGTHIVRSIQCCGQSTLLHQPCGVPENAASIRDSACPNLMSVLLRWEANHGHFERQQLSGAAKEAGRGVGIRGEQGGKGCCLSTPWSCARLGAWSRCRRWRSHPAPEGPPPPPAPAPTGPMRPWVPGALADRADHCGLMLRALYERRCYPVFRSAMMKTQIEPPQDQLPSNSDRVLGCPAHVRRAAKSGPGPAG